MSEPTTRARNPYYTSFPFGWYGLSWSDELAASEVKPLRAFDQELVLWRDAAGAAHVMDAYCAHLGAHLGHGGRVDGTHLVCPFHAWEWDADGRCARIPYAKRIPPGARVRSWPVAERSGLVMTWYHPRGAEPSFEVPEIPVCTSSDYAPTVKSEWRFASTWQETAENGPDFIHLKTVHGTPVLPELDELRYDGHRMNLRARVTYYSPRGDTLGRIDTEGHGPGFSVVRFSGIVELVMIDWCLPLDFETLVNHKGYRVSLAHGAQKAERIGTPFIADLKRQMDEDVAIFAHKIWREKPLLVAEDGPIAEFRRWAKQFYLEGSA